MYDNDNVTYRVGINWKDIVIKIIMFALFILLLLWLFPKANLDVFYDTVYNNNIKTMKEAARNYYTVDRLPKNVGDKTSMTLKEMVDNKMLIRFTDKDGKTCDENNSKVEVTKLSDSEYSLKVQLSCGSQNDYILETIGCTNVCSNGTCTTIINNNGSGNNTIANNNPNNNQNNNQNNGSDTERVDHDEPTSGDVKGNGYTITTTLYQHRKAVVTSKTIYTCPEGYLKDGTKCIKTTTGATIDATPVYNPDQVVTTDAKKGNDEIVNVKPIKTEIGTEYSCPAGYTQNGSYCIKYTDATEKRGDTTYTCPYGYTQNGSRCTKTYTARYNSGSTTYSCPEGGTLNGSSCTITTSGTPRTTYTCPSGYTQNGSSCYKVYNATANTTYSCPSGWTQNGSKCTKTTTESKNAEAKTTWGSWVNRGTKYYTRSDLGSNGDGKTEKLVLQGAISGATCGSPCGNKGIWYKYIYYTRSKNTTYSCPSGYTPSGSKCVKSSTQTQNATPNTTYSCPSGGTRSGTTCTLTVSGTPNTTYSCPSGYTPNGSSCVRTYSARPSTGNGYYSCPEGGTLNGSSCTITINATPNYGQTTYSCPTGYTYNSASGKCEYKINGTATKKYSYSCPTGYTQTGEGENMICSKRIPSDKYYCEDPEAKLEGTKCIKTIKGELKGYTCPDDYTLEGTKCTKQSTITIDANVSTETSTSYKYTWSEKSYLEGWEFTGKTKTQTKSYTAGQK